MESRARIKGMRSRAPRFLLGAVLVLVVFLLSYLLISGYQEQVRKAEVGTRNVATLLQTQLYETLRRTDADLAALAAELPREALDAKAVSRFQHSVGRLLVGRLINVERMDGLHVIDAEGNVLYSSLKIPAPELNVAARQYFRDLREDSGAGLVFSNVIRSGLTGRDVMVVARAIRDDGGRFLGAVISPLDVVSYKDQFAALEVGERGFVALRRRDGHALIARWPETGADVNIPLDSSHPFVSALPARVVDATVYGASEADPELRNHIVSLRGMPDYPLYFAVGFDRDSVLAGWYVHAMVVAFAVLVAIGLVAGLIMRLGRMRQREVVILSDLANSESQFSELVQLVPVGISRFDAQGNCVFVNDRSLLITGRKRDELIGNNWSVFVHPDDRRKVLASRETRGADGGVRICEYRLVRPDGQTVNVIGEVKAEKRPDGTIVGHIVAQTDITLMKKVETELMQAKHEAEKANQAKTRFLAAASHDLRQPIQAINLFKDALCRTELSEAQKTIARFLSLSVGSLSELLYSLLDISKLDAGLVRPQIKRVEVESVFEAVDDAFSSLAQQKNLRFKFFYPFNGPALETDLALLLTVLRNLIDNAFKYTKAGGVLVGFRRRGNQGVIQVWDTGIGIAPAFGEKIFEECFQVGNAAGDRAKGLGIGLSIARRTARLLGGDVGYRSRPGRGSVFEITVPASLEASEAPLALSDSGEDPPAEYDCSRINGWKVLVVEDDPVVAKSIELSLQAVGVSVQHYSSAEEALDSPSLLEADFYISDFVLPGRNGIELLDAIQQRAQHAINAVLMTGETSPERMESAKASGWSVLLKPAGLANLLSVMTASALGEAQELASGRGKVA